MHISTSYNVNVGNKRAVTVVDYTLEVLFFLINYSMLIANWGNTVQVAHTHMCIMLQAGHMYSVQHTYMYMYLVHAKCMYMYMYL